MSTWNPLVGIELERNLSQKNGQYFPDNVRAEQTWTNITNDPKREIKAKHDVSSQKPTGAQVKLKDGTWIDIVTDTGYGEVEVASPVYTDLNLAKTHIDESFQFVLEHTNHENTEKAVLLGIGCHPFLEANRENYFKYRTPKGHLYALLCEGSEHAPGRHWAHHHYLTLTSDQTNVDLPAGKEIQVMNDLNRVMGLLVGLSANSPFEGGRVNGHKSIRQSKLKELLVGARVAADRQTVGMPPEEPERLDWYFQKLFLEREMLFHGGGKGSYLYVILDEQGKSPSFHDFLASDLPWLGKTVTGESAEIFSRDEDIMSTLQRISLWNTKPQLNFSQAQAINKHDFARALKQGELQQHLQEKGVTIYTEVRTIDSAPPGEELAMPALIKGLVCNAAGLHDFAHRAEMDYAQWRDLYQSSGRTGLDWELKGKSSTEWCGELLKIAESGLQSVNEGRELPLLDPIRQRIDDKRCPADVLIEAHEKNGWEEVVSRISLHQHENS